MWTGCSNGGTQPKENSLSEGTIVYTAEVMDNNSAFASMAPNKMTVKFKNNKCVAEMNAGMGLLSTSFISNPDAKTFIILIKFMNKKYSVVKADDEIKKDNELFNLEIIPTKVTKKIAGYNCKKAIVHYKGGDPLDYDIYYTNELNIKNPNFSNPYYMVDGVLMEYKMKKFGLDIKFTAKSVAKEDVEDSNFNLPEDYKKITEAEMNEMFVDFQ